MGQVGTIPHAPVVPRRHQRRPGKEGRGAEKSEVGQRRLSKVQWVDQRMRLECGVGFRQLRTRRRTRPGQLCASGADIARRPPEGGLSFRKEKLSVRCQLGWKDWSVPNPIAQPLVA